MSPVKERSFTYRVYWEDTDAGGVVYHARYLHFLERSRSDLLLELGLPQLTLKQDTGKVFVVTRIETDFLKPAQLEDELVVSAGIEQMKKASMVFSQSIVRKADQQLLVNARIVVACVDAETFKPARLPDALMAAT